MFVDELLSAVEPFLNAAQETLPQVPESTSLNVEGFNHLPAMEVENRVIVPTNTHLRDIVRTGTMSFSGGGVGVGGEGSSGSGANQEITQDQIWNELELPLLDENTRRAELADRLGTNWRGMSYNERKLDSFVRSQLAIERHIEAALVADGYSPQVVLEKRHQIRSFIFYPDGRAFSEDTYAGYLTQIANFGTRQSVPYRRILGAVRNLNLFLD